MIAITSQTVDWRAADRIHQRNSFEVLKKQSSTSSKSDSFVPKGSFLHLKMLSKSFAFSVAAVLLIQAASESLFSL